MLYILSKGLVALNSRVRSHGEVWGEDFVLWVPCLSRSLQCGQSEVQLHRLHAGSVSSSIYTLLCDSASCRWVLAKDTSLIHPVTGYTLTYIEVLSLSRADLM